MLGRGFCVAVVMVLSSMQVAVAQNFPPIDSQTGAAPPIVRPKKPVQPPAGSSSDQGSLPVQQPSSSTLSVMSRDKKPGPPDPAVQAAQKQSGLSEVQARSLLQQRGYASVNGLQAQPNSVWVWQADVMKDGRPLRIGIDYRGNVLELGATATPCTLPGMAPTTGGFAVGARLSEASRCSGR